MALLLVSLGVLFAASLVGYLAIRGRAEAWPPPGAPPLPRGLWLSTVVLLISSGTMHWALASVRAGRLASLRTALLSTTLLGAGFMASQAMSWWALRQDLVAHPVPDSARFVPVMFYTLTVLHGLHVIGGLIPLTVVTRRAWRGQYSSGAHAAVGHCAMYWHFLDAVWVVMFAVLMIG
jgi:cytochrome c oxidase subunit 3